MLGKVASLKYFFHKWIEFSKSVYRVCNDWGLNIKIKKLPRYSAKATHNDCSRSEIVVKQIFNSDHKITSQVETGHMFKEISFNIAGFTDFFLNISVISFYFHFLQRMLSHPLCYSKSGSHLSKKIYLL